MNGATLAVEYAVRYPFCKVVKLIEALKRRFEPKRQEPSPVLDGCHDEVHKPEEQVLLTSLRRKNGQERQTPYAEPRFPLQSPFFQRFPFELRAQILRDVLCLSNDRCVAIVIHRSYIKDDKAFRARTGYKRRTLKDRQQWPVGKNYMCFRWIRHDDLNHWLYDAWARENAQTQSKPPGIMLTCRQAYVESLPILYSTNHFDWTILYDSHPMNICAEMDLLDRFGPRQAFSLIRMLTVNTPIARCIHECPTCEETFGRMWTQLGAMRGLRELTVKLVPGFHKDDEWREDFSWETIGVDWLLPRLENLKQVDQVVVDHPPALRWVAESLQLQLDPARFTFIENQINQRSF